MSEIDDVRAFHVKFGQLDAPRPTHLTKRKLAERANFMLEELIEFAYGAGLYLETPIYTEDGLMQFVAENADQDMEAQADALVDLCYVLKGTAAMMGLGAAWPVLWDDVQRANMEKEKGLTHRNMGHGADICKPPGWVGPMTGAILRANGYDRMAFEGGDGVIDDRKCLDDESARIS